jgi:predicted TIM-barrel fold metal-dependent hydrolase
MKIDMHVHLADVEALWAAPLAGPVPRASRHLARALHRTLNACSIAAGSKDANERWTECLAGWVKESQLDKVVVLALDAVFAESGRACPDRTVLHVDNDFVCSVAACHSGFMFGASIHPYRRDAVGELERLVAKGACLVKWIPSGQFIEPDDPTCYPFYEAMAHYGIPLLSHTGVEHTLGKKRSDYNHPRRLIPALERGVTVIAAHCGAHLFLHEPSFFGAWASLAREHENLYGDCGAFSIVTRIPYLKRICDDAVLPRKLLYGSDFPGIPAPGWCWQLGPRKMRSLSRINNPLERNVRIMQALGIPEDAFERAEPLLCRTEEVASDAC